MIFSDERSACLIGLTLKLIILNCLLLKTIFHTPPLLLKTRSLFDDEAGIARTILAIRARLGSSAWWSLQKSNTSASLPGFTHDSYLLISCCNGDRASVSILVIVDELGCWGEGRVRQVHLHRLRNLLRHVLGLHLLLCSSQPVPQREVAAFKPGWCGSFTSPQYAQFGQPGIKVIGNAPLQPGHPSLWEPSLQHCLQELCKHDSIPECESRLRGSPCEFQTAYNHRMPGLHQKSHSENTTTLLMLPQHAMIECSLKLTR